MRINNNTASFSIWSMHSISVNSLKKGMRKITTGTILNSENPVAIGISERMRSKISSTSTARQNIETGISMTQTSDGWMQQVQNQLSRMKELTVKANGIASPGDIANMQTEFETLQNEITRTTSNSTSAAKFNGIHLFRGGTGIEDPVGGTIKPGNITVQAGPDTGQEITINNPNLDITNTDVIGTFDTFEYDQQHNVTSDSHTDVTLNEVIDSVLGIDVNSPDATAKVDVAIDYVSNSRSKVAAQQSRLENTYSSLISYENNLRNSESVIRDQDLAMASVEFTRNLILSQVGNAMLGQANALPAAGMLQLIG